ncbi:sensor histidine kinase [Cohnella sp. CFH 77786]|uniref:cache domain-containing sensor histidine kinase n=1 Tax=Cohnella sp. CFH 77786 TaxID=2662265 RepID=UPI001C60997B|nr:histidine kinase [Cohnella sp. CFH 77786]
MRFWQSVRFKIVFGFALILAPMVAFLIYHNMYATGVVREQISIQYSKLLDANAGETDKILKEYRYYLLRLARDPDIPIIQSYPSDSDEYVLAKQRLLIRFALDSTSIYDMLDTLFLYPRKERNIIFATQYNKNSEEKESALVDWSRKNLGDPRTLDARWDTLTLPSGYHYFLHTVDLDLNVFAGALVPADSLMRVLAGFDVGPSGATMLLDSGGQLLAGSATGPAQSAEFRKRAAAQTGPYGILRGEDNANYLVMAKRSPYADLTYVLVMPESYILKNLPFFQKVLYFWIPLLVAALLSLYLLFLQSVVFRPLIELIRGMRKLGQGRFDIRLPVNRSSEFAFMSSSFNQMAEQIEKLKIDIYEEQLRVQRAEYKHLQVQINPHFYMNSLNIIYNLAALKDFKSVQKLSLHLADYFRFLMQSNRPVVALEDEIRHIGHYLEIQIVRYVTKLGYEIDVKPHHFRTEIPPLMIQPFVENSVIHAFNKRVQDGSLFRIAIRSEDEADESGRYVVLRVSDNGPGFPDAMLRELENGAYLSGNGEQHLGIWNVLRRFRMLYGEAGGISFRNAEEGGAVVEIRLPAAAKLPIGSEQQAREEPVSGEWPLANAR